MKKIGLVILMLFISSCTLPNLPFGGGQIISTGKGVKLEFLDYPKGQLDENEPFALYLRITNNSPEPVEGTLCLYDTPSERFGGIPAEECQDVSLEPAIEMTDFFEAQQDDYYFPSKGGTYFYKNLHTDLKQTTSISVMLRYTIKTTSAASVCILKPRITTEDYPSGCAKDYTITSIKQPSTPIQVTKIEKQSSSIGEDQVKLIFTIYLEQKEDGILLNKEDIYEIVSSKPMIEFSAGFYNGPNFKCTPVVNGKIDFREKQKVIKCATIYNLNQDFIEEPLVIEFNYGFQKTASIPEIELKAEDELIG